MINRTEILNIILVFFSLSIIGCKKEVNHDELECKNHLYYYKGKPFTGTALDYYESKQLSSKSEFRDGIITGESTTYGYDGEIIQQGNSSIISIDKALELSSLVERITLLVFQEGGPDRINYLIVTSKKHLDPDELSKVLTLIRSKILSGTNSVNDHKIDRIFIGDCELEAPQYDSQDTQLTN